MQLTKKVWLVYQLNADFFSYHTNRRIIGGGYVKQALIIISTHFPRSMFHAVVKPRNIVREHRHKVRISKGIHAFILSIGEQGLRLVDLP